MEGQRPNVVAFRSDDETLLGGSISMAVLKNRLCFPVVVCLVLVFHLKKYT